MLLWEALVIPQVAKKMFEPALLHFRRFDHSVRVVHALVPWLQKEKQTQLARRVHRQRLADCDEVFERLRHFEALNVQVPSMPKVIDPLRPPVVGLGLRHLIVVVRELQIFAPAMDVEELLVDVVGHHRALNVPTWPPRTPSALPSGLSGLRLFPHREVVRIALLGGLRRQRAFSLLHFRGTGARCRDQLSVVVASSAKRIDTKIHATVGLIAEAIVLKFFDVLLHPAVHILANPRLHIGSEHTKRVHILEVLVFEASGVGVEDRVIRDGVASILVELGHQRVPCRLQQAFSRRRCRGHFLLQVDQLGELELVLLSQFFELHTVLFRSAGRGLLRLLGQQLLLHECHCLVHSTLQNADVLACGLRDEVAEQLVLPGA
mmetsp:Transcript_83843/g.233921  ORF Transcript_83843/g.233921 Transcript_83843/m.233921 type:complete len:377 (-) Transcript_83843:660-1790(-)